MRIALYSAVLFATGAAMAATPVDGWYTSAFGGYSFFPDNIYNTNAAVFRNGSGYHAGYNAGGRFGYQSHPIRYELEYTYMQAGTNKFDVNYVRQTGVSGAVSTNFAMVNLYYDFPDMLPAIAPYASVGIGYASLHATLNSTGPGSATFFSASDNVFAYQGGVGITYNFAENYAVNLGGRYIATDKTSGFGRVFQAYLASVGAVYHFDNGNYT